MTLANPVSGSVPETVAPENAVVRGITAVRRALASVISPLGLALGSIFFIPRPWIGLVLWLALLRDPRYAVFALWGMTIGALIKRVLRISDGPGLGGGVKANALLAAVVTGWMTGALNLPWSQQLLLAGAAAVAAALVAAAVMRVLAKSVMPALLWGYCLVAAMLFSVCPDCTVLAANAMPPWLQPTDTLGWGVTFLRSMGSLMYSPDAWAGAIVCLAILLWSRTIFISGLVGWISGVCLALGFQSLHLVYYWLPVSYNYFITGMALGSVIFLPGRVSLLVAAVGGGVTAFFGLVLQYRLGWSASSYLPVSSALATWVGIGALTLADDRSIVLRNTLPDMPPEERWWHVAFWSERFGRYVPLFAVPVAGDLQISQGFDGKLSHSGMFRYALDFQRPRSAETGIGSIWSAVVTSPVSGVVDRIKNTVPDNPLGVCNYADKWGNYVVIRLDTGGWALLAHLQQGTVAVAPGARVETGSYLGRVGNSGRSPVPHLHVHLQDSPEPGAPTSSFRLANYQSTVLADGSSLSWKAAAVPAEGEAVMAAPQNTAVYLALVGMAPGSAVWVAESAGRIPRAFRPRKAGQTQRVDVVVDSLGQHVFDAGSAGKLISRLDPDAWRVLELSRVTSPLLKLLALSAPSIPYAAKTGMVWSDLAPTMPSGGVFSPITLIFAPYFRHPFPRVSCTCIAEPRLGGDLFEIVSQVDAHSSALPLKVSCQFAALRGPVKIRADFRNGSLTFSLLSYEPGIRSGAFVAPV